MEKAKLQQLAEMIKAKIRAGFEEKHLTGNLMDTLEVVETPDGFDVNIPAEIYNMYRWWRYGVVIHTGKGSYASELDKRGSHFQIYWKNAGWSRRIWVSPGNHKGFVMEAINDAIAEWAAINGYTIRRTDE